MCSRRPLVFLTLYLVACLLVREWRRPLAGLAHIRIILMHETVGVLGLYHYLPSITNTLNWLGLLKVDFLCPSTCPCYQF